MLKQRVITALVMLAVLLPAVLYPEVAVFAVVAAALLAAAAWEWARLNQCTSAWAWVCGVACGLACAATWWGGALVLAPVWWVVAGGAWVLFAAWVLSAGASVWLAVPRWLRVLGGMVALWLAWVAVVQARSAGINFLFSVLSLVWVADIGAYFCGRAFGGRWFKRKLAPAISPGKTWEGALGGLVGVLVLAVMWRWMDTHSGSASESLYTQLGQQGWLWLVLAVAFLSTMSVVGDLVESLFKRSVGVKDSSALLPGHGGVLDRIDALLPVLPLVMMVSGVWR